MANKYRGEIEAELGGVKRTLVLTLGALAELEDAFGAEDLVALGRHAEAEQQVVQITGALGQREFGQQLLNYIRGAAR